jgi:hypothetical protein
MYSREVLSSTPNLVHLVLRHIECAFLLRKMTSNSVKAGISHEQLIFALDRIIETPDLHAELLTRAMIIRVSEWCIWQPNGVKDIYNAPASETIKQKGFHSSKAALSMHEEAATTNGAAVNFTHTMVRRSLGYSLGEGEWLKVCKALPNLDRDDLYFSLKGLTQSIFRAVSMDDAVGLRECLPALNETLSLGEWGKIFYDKWWKTEERKLVGSGIWRRACVGIWSAPFMPEMRSVSTRPPLQHAYTSPPSSNSNSMGKSIAGAVGKAVLGAVANEAVHEVVDLATGNNNNNNIIF